MLYALSFAFFGMGFRFVVFMLGWDIIWSTQFYFLFMLLAIFLAVRETFIKERGQRFGQLFKVGAQVGSVFALLVTFYTYVLYRWIDLDTFPLLIQERIDEAIANGYSPEQLEQLRQGLEVVFTANTQSLATLIGFMLLSFSYAALVSLILTKLPFFARPLK